MRSEATTFRGRRAIQISNDRIELTALLGGGHIAELRLIDACVNPLWQPHWNTIELEDYDPGRHPEYGYSEGKLLASIAGHTLCLNHFGELSEAELAAQGFEHGEAANLPWQLHDARADTLGAFVDYGLELPEAGMQFKRTIALRPGSNVASFEEQVTNLRRSDSPLAYQQHVTLGAPFVEPGVSRLDLSGTRAHTYPRSFGDIDPLTPDREFKWPAGPGLPNLNVFPSESPLSCVCTVALESEDDLAFVAVSNPRLGLLLAYVFPADTFPWVALWYEHGGITDAPYDGRTVAWGIEFGTCAFPQSRIEMLTSGPLLGRPRCGVLPALTTIHVSYEAILQAIPTDWRGVAQVTRHDGQFCIAERETGRELHVGGAS
jgi:hypothetical protein